MKDKPRILLALAAIIVFLCFFNKNDAFADKQYLDLSYNKVRYEQEDGKGTTIWYAYIPAKYKMHYAYGRDIVLGGEKPSENAKRHQATIAVNSQTLGFPFVNDVRQDGGANVSGFDFSIEKNPNPTAVYDVFKVYANSITSPENGISFAGINLGFDYFGDHVHYENEFSWQGTDIFMALFNQIVQDGTVLDFDNISSNIYEFATTRHPRTWLAYDSYGGQYVAVSAGRDDGTDQLSQAGLNFREIYDATRRFLTTDIKTLYNLDGGGSCGFIYKGEKINPNYDDNYTKERDVSGIFYWKVETQQVSFEKTSVTKTYGDAIFTNAATTTGNGAITYGSSNTNVATVDKNTGAVTIKSAGTTTITATAAATDIYNSASASYTLTVNKHAATVSFENTQVTKTYGDAIFTNAATTTGNGAITYGSSNTNVATVDKNTGAVTIKSAGTTTITATAAATDIYNSASASYTLTVNKHAATVSFENTQVTKTYGDAIFTNAATTTGNGAITYGSSNTNVATVDKNTGAVTIKSAGTTTITATAAAVGNYEAASASYMLTINKKTSQAPTEISDLKNGYVTDYLSSISFSTLGLAWVNPEEKIKEGSHFYLASYTEHNDATNYTTEQYEITVLGERRKYNVIEGDRQTFTISKDKTIRFRFDAKYELFINGGEIYIDDILVEQRNYDIESGSTIISFHYDYINTLASGEHTLVAIFNDGGLATTNFALAIAEAEDPNSNKIATPNTGSNTSTKPELESACAISVTIITATLYLYRRKSKNKKDHLVFD